MNVKRATLHQPIWKGAENCPPGVSEEARKSKYVLERRPLWVDGVHAPQNNHVLRLGTKCPALPRVCCPHQPLNHPLPSRPRYGARAFFCPPEHFFCPPASPRISPLPQRIKGGAQEPPMALPAPRCSIGDAGDHRRNQHPCPCLQAHCPKGISVLLIKHQINYLRIISDLRMMANWG